MKEPGDTHESQQAYLLDLAERMAGRDEPEIVYSSDESPSWHAYREAETLTDPRLVASCLELFKKTPQPEIRAACVRILERLAEQGLERDLIYQTLFKSVESGREKTKTLEAILDALREAEWRVPSIDPLIPLMRRRSWHISRGAIGLLGYSGDPRAVEPLNALLAETESKYTIDEAVEALGQLAFEEGLEGLESALEKKTSTNVRMGLGWAFSRIGGPTAHRHLADLLNDRQPAVRWAAIRSIRIYDTQGEMVDQVRGYIDRMLKKSSRPEQIMLDAENEISIAIRYLQSKADSARARDCLTWLSQERRARLFEEERAVLDGLKPDPDAPSS